MCEAVLEGMGSKWDCATNVKRHPNWDRSQKEAMTGYNAPPAYLPEAKPLVVRALNHHFKQGKDWTPHFIHTDARQRQINYTAGSKTLNKMRQTPMRLPAAAYDVPALE